MSGARGGAQDGGPVFPAPESSGQNATEGMSLRDHFAGLAMQTLVAGLPTMMSDDRAYVAQRSYLIADAMLEARAAQRGGEVGS